MAKLLGVDIAKLINQSLGKLLYDGVLTRMTPGERSTDVPTAGTSPKKATFTFKGFAADYAQLLSDRQLVRQGNAVILIVAQSGQMSGVQPKPFDTIVLTGDPHLGASTAIIAEKGVHRDPAGATWLCEVLL